MSAPSKIYFAQLAVGWEDWVQIVNVGLGPANVMAIARDIQGQTVWSQETKLNSFQAWTVAADTVKIPASLVVSSDKPIAGERHCHSATEVLTFPGASPEGMTVGRRLFFPDISSEGENWFQILNISEQNANINIVVRSSDGRIYKQFGTQGLKPLCWWNFTDNELENINGTVELISTQPVVGERHLHYKKSLKGSAVGQLGQVLDKVTRKLYFPEISESWNDWLQIVNVGNEMAKVTAVARNQKGEAVWSAEAQLNPFQAWNPNVEGIKGDVSVTVVADKHIVGERHDHRGIQILNFPGASLEMRTAGWQLFFPETYVGGSNVFRFMNIGEVDSWGSVVSRDREGNVKRQENSSAIPPMGYWVLTDNEIGNITGTLETFFSQPMVGERHLQYKSNIHSGITIGQFGQVID